MKTSMFAVLCGILTILTACTKEKITPPAPDTPAMAIARSAIEKTSEWLLSASWQITSYQKVTVDRTDLFKNYELTFSPNGNVTATRSGLSYTGKWVVTYIDSLPRVSANFTAPASFVELSGDWTAIESNENKLKMQKVLMPGDFLTIEKK